MIGPSFLSVPSLMGATRKVPLDGNLHQSLILWSLHEDFSYFTLRRRILSSSDWTSAFGISCTRQIDTSELLHRAEDVTRSTVQKALVVIASSPQSFGQIKEKLSMVAGAWFAQR